MKICTECKQGKSLNHFSKNISKKDGLSSHCKECHKIFTFDKKEQYKIVDNFKKNRLMSEENIRKMIISDNINLGHLKFLHKDNYINQSEFNNLQQDLKTRDFYRSI